MTHYIGKIDLVVFDFDGVLTDNRVLVMEDGREAVFCNRADGLAFDMFRSKGVAVLILSTETNPVVAARGRKLKVPVVQAIADKGSAIDAICRERGIEPARVMYVGNDVNDLAAMERVGVPVAVADAHASVKAACALVLQTRGGDGVAREIADLVIDMT